MCDFCCCAAQAASHATAHPFTGIFSLYIVSGTADVLVKWTDPQKPTAKTSGTQGASASASHDDFMDESETMSPITDDDSRENRIKLLRASMKAQDFIKKLQEAAGNGGAT